MEQIKLRNKFLKLKQITGTSNQFVANAILCDRSTISKFTSGKDLPSLLAIKLDSFICSTISKLDKLD